MFDVNLYYFFLLRFRTLSVILVENVAVKTIILDEGKKAMFAKCFLKYKLETKTVIEAEHKARLDPEYKDIVNSLAHAESNLIKAKLNYNNLDRYSSMKQTEIKTDIKLANRQEG